jgi:hypothetical protein
MIKKYLSIFILFLALFLYNPLSSHAVSCAISDETVFLVRDNIFVEGFVFSPVGCQGQYEIEEASHSSVDPATIADLQPGIYKQKQYTLNNDVELISEFSDTQSFHAIRSEYEKNWMRQTINMLLP